MVDDYDSLAKRYMGEHYQLLTPQQQLENVVYRFPVHFFGFERKDILSGARNLGDQAARDAAFDLMTALEELPRVLDSLEKLLAENERKSR